MDGVTVFVSEGRYVVECALKVHGEIGFGGVRTPAVCAAAFAAVGHGVDPAFLVALPENVDVFVA